MLPSKLMLSNWKRCQIGLEVDCHVGPFSSREKVLEILQQVRAHPDRRQDQLNQFRSRGERLVGAALRIRGRINGEEIATVIQKVSYKWRR